MSNDSEPPTRPRTVGEQVKTEPITVVAANQPDDTGTSQAEPGSGPGAPQATEGSSVAEPGSGPGAPQG